MFKMERIEDELDDKTISRFNIKKYAEYCLYVLISSAAIYYGTYKLFNKPKWEEREIILGPSNNTHVVVDSGLIEGEKVLLYDPTKPFKKLETKQKEIKKIPLKYEP